MEVIRLNPKKLPRKYIVTNNDGEELGTFIETKDGTYQASIIDGDEVFNTKEGLTKNQAYQWIINELEINEED